MTTKDDDERVRVGPKTTRTRRDNWIPYQHGKWWNFNSHRQKTKTTEQLLAELAPDDLEDMDRARAILDHVEAIAQSAVDRAAAADRRATTIAGTVAIAASFTLSGASLMLDAAKVPAEGVRAVLGFVLFLTTLFFVASATYALRALVATRHWYWSYPRDLPGKPDEPLALQLSMRSVNLLQDFAGNWEIADLKNRNVDLALRCLVAALGGLTAAAGIIAAYALVNYIA